jgi:hypothetical protein
MIHPKLTRRWRVRASHHNHGRLAHRNTVFTSFTFLLWKPFDPEFGAKLMAKLVLINGYLYYYHQNHRLTYGEIVDP